MAALTHGTRIKISTIVLLLLNVAIWGWLSLDGYFGIKDVARQRAVGYPTTGQIHYYLYTPIVILLISVLWSLAFWRASAWIRNSVLVAALIFCPCYLFFYTGGM